MKFYRNAIILVVVVALLTTALVFIKKNKKDSGDAAAGTQSNSVYLMKYGKDKISEITVERADAKYVFAKTNGKWGLAEPKGLQFDVNRIEGIELNLEELETISLVEQGAKDLARYGLAKPIVITVKSTDGKTQSVELGNETSTKEGYYAKLKSDNNVYTVSTVVGEMLSANLSDMREKYILSNVKTDDITGFSLGRGGSTIFTVKKADTSKWNLTYPINAGAYSTKLTPMLDPLIKMKIESFVESNASDLAKYGLDKPQYTLEVTTADKKVKILLGADKVKDTEVYAKLDGSNEVFTMKIDELNFLDAPLNEVVDPFIFIPYINDVTKLEVDIDGQTIKCDIYTDPSGKKDQDKDKFFVNGKNATVKDENGNQPFRNFYGAVVGVSQNGVIPDAKPSGKAEITFRYTMKKDSSVVKIEFIPKDAEDYYVLKDGKYTGLTVAKETFSAAGGVREAYKTLMDTINKKQ